LAANNFSLTPPILRTYPVRDISPVIANSLSVYKFSAKLTRLDVIDIPADGPSFLLDPAGK
jgi:hypothetical protein